MKLDDIFDTWNADTVITDEMGEENRKIPLLHAKYVRWLTLEKLALKKVDEEYKKLWLAKQEFYVVGPTSAEDLAEKRTTWKMVPDTNKKVIRSNVTPFLDADDDLIEVRLRRALLQGKVELLEYIMKQIGNRSFIITSMTNWKIMQAGGR